MYRLTTSMPYLLVPYGTHTVFIGEVTDASAREPIAPLVYQNAAYCVTKPAA